METYQAWFLRVQYIQLKVYYLRGFHPNISSDPLNQRPVMLLYIPFRGTIAHQLLGEYTGNNGLQVSLLIGFKCARLISQVDCEVRDLEQGLVLRGIPILAYQAIALSHYDLAGKGEVPVEPGVPQATPIGLHVQLVEAVTIPKGTDRGQLEYR